MSLPCKWDVQIGKFMEFIDSQKGTKALLFSVIGVIVIQIGAFLIIWGGMLSTVKTHDKNIDFLMNKFNNIKLIGYVNAEPTDERP